MARTPQLRTHPQEGEKTLLADYIFRMPGGPRLEGWEDGPTKVIALWLQNDNPRLPLPYVFDAYPPREAFKGDWSSGYIFVVPELVAQMLTWYAEEHEWQADEVKPAYGESIETLVEGLAPTWARMPEDSIEEVQELHENTLDAAAEHGLDPKALRETALTLWRDSDESGDHEPYEEHLTRAIAVLTR